VSAVGAALGRRIRPIRDRLAASRWGRLPRAVRLVTVFLAGGALLVVLAGATLVGTTVASSLYDTYGFHPEKNAASWASLAPSFADTASCRACHAAEYATWTGAKHSTLSCQTCHGPLAAHAANPDEVKAPSLVAASSASSNLCARCHDLTTGRPAGFAQQDLATHYRPWSCDRCHDPHAATGIQPPAIPHPLGNLPACTTCHGPQGMKPMPRTHDESTDAICLGCHKLDAVVAEADGPLSGPTPAARPSEETAP
jgi:predicted CXXCH cytochrome family protein